MLFAGCGESTPPKLMPVTTSTFGLLSQTLHSMILWSWWAFLSARQAMPVFWSASTKWWTSLSWIIRKQEQRTTNRFCGSWMTACKAQPRTLVLSFTAMRRSSRVWRKTGSRKKQEWLTTHPPLCILPASPLRNCIFCWEIFVMFMQVEIQRIIWYQMRHWLDSCITVVKPLETLTSVPPVIP